MAAQSVGPDCNELEVTCEDYALYVAGDVQAIINAYSSNQYVSEYDSSNVHFCDTIGWYFLDMADYMYICIYNSNDWQESFINLDGDMQTEMVKYNPTDDDECEVEGYYCYLYEFGFGQEYYWEPCLSFYEESEVCARCKFGMVRLVS